MAIFYVNPFERLYPQFSSGLDYVIANYPGSGSPDINNLNNVVVTYIQSLLIPATSPPATLTPFVADLVNSIILNSVNDYINTQIDQNLGMSSAQMDLIYSIYDGIKSNTIESLDQYFDGVDELITTTECISTVDKTPVYMASIIARSSYDYWITTVATPGSWSAFINSNAAINYANIPNWVALSFVSALSGYSQFQKASVSFIGTGISNDGGRFIGSPLSLGASLGVTAGKVIFQWAQRPSAGYGVTVNFSKNCIG